MRLATLLAIAAALIGASLWLLIEHQRTNRQIERLQEELQRLKTRPAPPSGAENRRGAGLQRAALDCHKLSPAWL